MANTTYDRLDVHALLESLFAVSDSSLIDASFDDIVESKSTGYHQDDFIERALHLGSVIQEAGKKSARKRAIVHNTSVWPLPSELTIKVFSMLDTRSTCTAAATCSFFQKCAEDPLCYTNIDLATFPQKLNVPKLNNDVVSTMIDRAGKSLQSIKLALHSYISYDEEYYGERYETPILTLSCLSSLNANGGALGSGMRKLHIHYNQMRDEDALASALSACLSVCPSLVELKLVQIIVPLCRILEFVSRYCRLLEHFFFEFNGDSYPYDDLESLVFKEFLLNCPKITDLTLHGCKLLDPDAFELVKGFHNLKFVDFAGCHRLTGAFLKNLVTQGGGSSLEAMILHEVEYLDELPVKTFMEAVIAGKFRHLRHLDISKSGGPTYYDSDDEHYAPDDERFSGVPYAVSSFDIPVNELLQHRPNFCMVVEYNESDP